MAPVRKKEIPASVKIIGQNIKNIITEKELKIRHVAHDADMDIEALRRYIKGQQVMGVDKVVSIAKALSVDIKDIFEGTKTV